MEKLISIIIPVYNAEKYLDECLESVLTQTYRNLEVILINDGSKDSSESICKAWAEKDSRIRYVYQQNAGVGAARNRGMDMATGEYVAFVDADDYLDPNFCTGMVNAMADGADIAFCEEIDLRPGGNILEGGSGSLEVETIPSAEYGYWDDTGRYTVWASLFKKEVLQGMRFSETLPVGEDSLFIAQAILRAKTLAYYHARLYTYRIYNGSSFHGKFDQKKKTQIDSWVLVSQVFPEGSVARLGAEAICAEVCIDMLRTYAGDPAFDQKTIDELIRIYRKLLPKLVRFDRARHHSYWKHILIGIMPNVFVRRQRKAKK